MKKGILFIIVMLSMLITKAQKNQNVYFFKDNGKEVNSKDSADYIRIIREPDSGEVNFNFLEFYLDGKKKSLGKVSAFEPWLVFEGMLIKFNKLGRRISVENYEKGVLAGMSYHYYENGKIHKQIEWLPSGPKLNQPFIPTALEIASSKPVLKLVYLADSLGVEQVRDGNGHAKEIIGLGKNERIEEGDYKDGVKHGIWKGSGSQFGTSFIETYEMGKLIGGESTRDGQKYQYTTEMSPPQFKGGIQKFYEYLSYTIKYPSDAGKNRISGTVFLSFTVEGDGSLSEIEVKKSVYPSLDNEAVRAVKFSPKWLPGMYRGLPVRVKYNIPVKFNLP